ncbi:uncharacterized protein LOC120440288 isoform X2 [Oreochromis aureus]|uniref:uncharacterized protein LOC120440288 isoform X2 n=1 Tax=Oreochromis aureus TaxID=47969 RepID=UPI001953F4FA|nr:uncharacterized protein LOC120440288 isoform X2 [Oreochromis aureus]
MSPASWVLLPHTQNDPAIMDPADSSVTSDEETLAQLWGYCRNIIWTVDPHKRHIQVVFFDNFLSSTTFPANFFDINKQTGLVEALAAWFFTHRRPTFPSMLAAQLFDPPLRKRCRPHHHHPITPQPTPAASAGPAGDGPTVFITAVSKPDSIVSLDPVIKNLNADEQDGTVSFNTAPPPRKRQRLHRRHTTFPLTPLAFEELVDSGLAAQGAAVSKTESVGGEKVFAGKQKVETVLSEPQDRAQSVNGKTRPTMGNKLKNSDWPEDEHELTSNSGSGLISVESIENRFPCFPSEDEAFILEAVNPESLDYESVNLKIVFVDADQLGSPLLESPVFFQPSM